MYPLAILEQLPHCRDPQEEDALAHATYTYKAKAITSIAIKFLLSAGSNSKESSQPNLKINKCRSPKGDKQLRKS
jgi:hypothetical protein